MRKTRKRIQEAATAWASDFRAHYPDAETEIIDHAPGGFDIYVRIEVPHKLDDDLWFEMLHKTVLLSEKYRELTGVNIVATVVDREAVTHG
jgi:hypothetical protein